MNKPKRPQIKLPEVKVPGFLSDLASDLRDRHLLPLVGLLWLRSSSSRSR